MRAHANAARFDNGELARWFINTLALDVDCQVITMQGWQPEVAPGSGWPLGERTWINPSPNAPNLWMTRVRRNSHAGGHHTLRRPRYNPPLERLARPASMSEHCSKPCAIWLRSGVAAACGNAGLNRPFTNMRASFAGCKSRKIRLQSRCFPPLALAGAGVESTTPATAGLPAMA